MKFVKLFVLYRVDTTRVEFTIPLRENWALPFFAVQIAAITYLLRTHLQPVQEVSISDRYDTRKLVTENCPDLQEFKQMDDTVSLTNSS